MNSREHSLIVSSHGHQTSLSQRRLDATNDKTGQIWPYTLLGSIVIIALTGGFLAWGALAEIDGAIIAEGEFVVENDRQTIQHLDGGIIHEIYVNEGEAVSAGQVLLQLDPTVDRANIAIVENELFELDAQRTRLLAELNNKRQLNFAVSSSAASLSSVHQGQQDLFKARLHSRDSERELRTQRIAQLRDEIDGLTRQQESNARQIELVDQELEGLRRLLERKLVARSRVLALEREAERIRGLSEALNVQIARARSAIEAVHLEDLQSDRQFKEQVTTELRLIEPRLTRLREQQGAAARKLSLIDIRSPSDGFIVDMQVNTPGGVIRGGDKILDVVPTDKELVLEAQIAPVDIDKVSIGQIARVQLAAFDQIVTPEANAQIVALSADSLMDERTGQEYYLARLQLLPDQPDALADLDPIPGMPAIIFVQTGSRTPISYLLKPFNDRLDRVFAEI